MTSHGRTLIVVAVVSLLGIAALGFMAGRYGDLAAKRAGAGSLRAPTRRGTDDPEHGMGSFLAVRREVKLAVGRNRAALDTLLAGSGPEAAEEGLGPGRRALEDVLRTRARALESAGLAPERYEDLREAYQRWKEDDSGLDPGLRATFEARRWELLSTDLGRYERLGF